MNIARASLLDGARMVIVIVEEYGAWEVQVAW